VLVCTYCQKEVFGAHHLSEPCPKCGRKPGEWVDQSPIAWKCGVCGEREYGGGKLHGECRSCRRSSCCGCMYNGADSYTTLGGTFVRRWPPKQILGGCVASELLPWILSAVRHSIHVEYYLTALGLGREDPERPHDLVGIHNKLHPEILACVGRPKYKKVEQAVWKHRGQHHHRMWNKPDRNDPIGVARQPYATDGDMLVGAVDTICSLREPRGYQGGTHSWDEIRALIPMQDPHKRQWLRMVLPLMEGQLEPDLSYVNDLERIPVIRIEKENHELLVSRVKETLAYIREAGIEI